MAWRSPIKYFDQSARITSPGSPSAGQCSEKNNGMPNNVAGIPSRAEGMNT